MGIHSRHFEIAHDQPAPARAAICSNRSSLIISNENDVKVPSLAQRAEVKMKVLTVNCAALQIRDSHYQSRTNVDRRHVCRIELVPQRSQRPKRSGTMPDEQMRPRVG